LVEKIVRDDPWVHAIVYNPMSLIDTTKGIYHRSEKVSKNNNKIDIYLKMKAK
jgi:hypothetical protein